MRVQGALIREQGQTFAVVAVKPQVIQNRSEAADAIRSFSPVFWRSGRADGSGRAGPADLLRSGRYRAFSVGRADEFNSLA